MRKNRVMALSMAALMTATSLAGSAFALENAKGVNKVESSKIPFNVMADKGVAGASAGAAEVPVDLDSAMNVSIATDSITGISYEYDKTTQYVKVNYTGELKEFGFTDQSTDTTGNTVKEWKKENKFTVGTDAGSLSADKAYYFFAKKADGNVIKLDTPINIKTVDSIEVTVPTKTNYVIGDKLDLAGSQVKVYAKNKELIDTVNTKEDMVVYKTDSTGKQTVTVNLAGKTTAFDINVEGKVTGIEIKGVTTEYKRKKKFDGRGYIVATYDLGGKKETREVNLEDKMIFDFNTDKVGKHTVTVRYQNCEAKYDIYVEELEDEVEITIDGKEYGLDRQDYYYEEGDYFKLPRDIKSSRYELIGFTEDRNWDGGEYLEPGEEVEAEDDTTYYMICKDKDREYVVYIDNDPDEKHKEDEDEVYIVRKDRDFEFKKHAVPKGYKFIGYSKEKNSKGKIYEVGDEVEVTRDITYYVIKEKDSNTSTTNLPKADGLDSAGKNYSLRNGMAVKSHIINSGYIRGYEDMTFRPYATLRRDEFAVMLDRVFNIQSANNPYNYNFYDVTASWSKESVQRMAAAGVVMGYGNGMFNPTGNITKEEALMMISRIVYVDNYDASKGKTGNVEVNKAIAAGLADKIDVGNMTAPLTRLEAVKLINEVIYKDTTTSKYVYFSDIGNTGNIGNVTNSDYLDIMKAAIAR